MSHHRDHELEHTPEGEREEVRQIFVAKGFSDEMLGKVVAVITADKKSWVDTMIQEEHGLPLTQHSGLKAALAIFASISYCGQHFALVIFCIPPWRGDRRSIFRLLHSHGRGFFCHWSDEKPLR